MFKVAAKNYINATNTSSSLENSKQPSPAERQANLRATGAVSGLISVKNDARFNAN
jgi:hypothetical protein